MFQQSLSALILLFFCVDYVRSANSVTQGTGFPTFIPTSGSFNVPVAYSSDGTNTVVVDVMKSTSPYTWYGKGTQTVTSGASGTLAISVTLSNSPPAGAGTMLKLWIVSTSIYNSNPGTASSSQLASAEYPLNVGSSGSGSGGNDPGPQEPLDSYDFVDLLNKTLWFYEAQRSGDLPSDNRVSWRHDSALGDKGANNEDLTGGWYDAGDGVKFNFPMAYSATVLAWSVVDHRAVYQSTGQLVHALSNLKWACDYFIKCHVSDNELYGQVGNGALDHAFWGRPEDMVMNRPAYKIDTTHPGSELAAETAAALAASSIAFSATNQAYANTLRAHAITLFTFANTYKGKYSTSIADAAIYYNSGDYWDELTWAAAWLYRATGTASYLTTAQSLYSGHGIGNQNWAFSWDQKSPGVMALMYKITGTQSYQTDFESFMTSWMPGGGMTYTPKGIAWRDQWGSLRYAANTAFLALMDADYVNATNPARARTYFNWALGQIKLMVGDAGRSYVVGFGYNPPTHPHHRAASCPPVGCSNADFTKASNNPNILYGALVGGPDQNDVYVDVRSDYQKNEVACDYNAGFTGAVARLAMESARVPAGTQGGPGPGGPGSSSPASFATISLAAIIAATLAFVAL